MLTLLEYTIVYIVRVLTNYSHNTERSAVIVDQRLYKLLLFFSFACFNSPINWKLCSHIINLNSIFIRIYSKDLESKQNKWHKYLLWNEIVDIARCIILSFIQCTDILIEFLCNMILDKRTKCKYEFWWSCEKLWKYVVRNWKQILYIYFIQSKLFDIINHFLTNQFEVSVKNKKTGILHWTQSFC